MRNNVTWKKFINTSKYFEKMQKFVDEEKNICPLKENVFRFLKSDLSNIKCVILGMDPYASTYIDGGIEKPVATGRSFEVANVYKFTDRYKQASLANIFKTLCYYKFGKKYKMEELRALENNNSFKYLNTKDWFDAMEKQGVLFLNASLTTKIGKPGAHIKIWEQFMNELINFIDENTNCKWLIWGDSALKRVESLVDKNNIIYCCHPASRSNNNFIEFCCFKKVKNIDWF